jgi:hypothetical protein
MYHSIPGFIHLIWAMISFLLPLRAFYLLNCFLYFPLLCFEFIWVYLNCLQSCKIGRIVFNWPSTELAMIYLYLLLVIMLIPGRKAAQLQNAQIQQSDITQQFILNKVRDPSSWLLWKLMFLFSLKLHTPVLIFIWFFGSQQFNFFRLGFMLFFIIFGASQRLYLVLSWIMPAFVSFFICGQYLWPLAKDTWQPMITYNQKVDFLYILQS